MGKPFWKAKNNSPVKVSESFNYLIIATKRRKGLSQKALINFAGQGKAFPRKLKLIPRTFSLGNSRFGGGKPFLLQLINCVGAKGKPWGFPKKESPLGRGVVEKAGVY